MNSSIVWNFSKGAVRDEQIESIEKYFCVKLPQDYIECASKNDASYPSPDRFSVNGKIEVFNNLISLNTDMETNIISVYENVKDKIEDNIIPFGDDPFGNLLCFDYRNGDNPTIVFWEHERAAQDKEAALLFASKSFTELLGMLKEASDE